MDIASKTLSTSFWATIEKVGTMGIQFAISMLLARLLDPNAYGTVAMLSVFIALAGQIIECGFSNALIRKKDCTQADLSTAFFFNIIAGFAAYLLLFLTAPLVGKFYNMPALSPILRANGLIVLTNSCLIVPNAILTRQLAFRKMARYNILTSMLGGLRAVFLAFKGLGVWALVFQSLASSILVTIFLWGVTRWKPSFVFSMKSFKYLWGFGSRMLASGLISTLYGNIYSLVIGKFYTSADLGLFNRGQNIALMLPMILAGTFGKSTLPILSKIQDDKQRFTHVYRQYGILLSFISYPFVFMTLVLAKPFIILVLTAKWAGAVFYMQLFALTGLTIPMGAVSINLLQAAGRSDYTLKAEVIKKSVAFALVAMLCPISPVALAYGVLGIEVFIYSINLYYARKVLNLPFIIQLKDPLPFFFASGITGLCAWASIFFIGSYFLQIIVGSIVGILVYFLITKYVIKVPYYDYLIAMVKERKRVLNGHAE